jgi:hypothetical protein
VKEAKANRTHGIIKFRVPIPRRLQTNPYRVLEKGSLNLYPVDGCNALTNTWGARRNCRNESFIVRRIASIDLLVSQPDLQPCGNGGGGDVGGGAMTFVSPPTKYNSS